MIYYYYVFVLTLNVFKNNTILSVKYLKLIFFFTIGEYLFLFFIEHIAYHFQTVKLWKDREPSFENITDTYRQSLFLSRHRSIWSINVPY